MYVIYASELWKFSHFHILKTAISLTIIIVGTSDTLFQKHLISGVNILHTYIQSMQFPFITNGMVL